jgi:hypothetical protein
MGSYTSSRQTALKTVCWGEHLGLMEHENAIEGWEGCALYLIDDMVIVHVVVAIESHHPNCKYLLP